MAFRVTVTEETAARLRPELTRLIAEFRAMARMLVGALPNPDLDDDLLEEVEVGGRTWWIHWHDPHYRCESDTGVVVEAQIYHPDQIDPAFLLEYARTAGGHEAVVTACPRGFHDIARLLDLVPDLVSEPPQRG
ncbi:hypothetical protein AB0E59_34485 [Lentzea sp. NPDC034063]|uniref:hypothetical protein n=1 Tax=unclassified Lentzea TaxID=2643253 RepID=UPI0033EA8A5C